MYKKFAFYLGIIALTTLACQTEEKIKQVSQFEIKSCIDSGGEYDLIKGNCICNNMECAAGEYCKTNDNSLICSKCEDSASKCIDHEYSVKCLNGKWDYENGILCENGCNMSSGECEDIKECQKGQTKCEENVFYNCIDNIFVGVENCSYTCDTERQTCFECDGNSSEKQCENGIEYKCENGYRVDIKNCDYGCFENKCKDADCQTGEMKCKINNNGQAFVLTCDDTNKWPDYDLDSVNAEGNNIEDNPGITYCGYKECLPEILANEGSICERHTVQCTENRCVENHDWEKLSCEEYKAVVLSFVNKFEGIDYDRFSKQLGSWFKIKFNGELLEMGNCLEYKTPISICKPSNEGYFLFPKLKDEIELVDGVSIDVYKNGNNTKCDDSSNTEGDDSNNTELQGCLDSGDVENNMECKYNTISTVDDCKNFIENYMCEFDNYFENGQKLFSIVSDEAKGAVLSCNPETNTWDIKQVEPCLTITFKSNDDTTTQCEPYCYDVQFTLKSCAEPFGDDKYSNVCAISEDP